MTVPWDERFESVVRPNLPLLEPETPLAPDAAFAALGLDSMQTVSLLVEVEEAYDIVMPDEALAAETFAGPLSLWRQVSALLPVPATGADR
ncbi:phosphopantetheine-binding protein [Streptomyces sp. NPDC005820]|uniref:phosphopantetheine-binding protein n=1 Tax=Streptomyces sp. NPDC005820 TaxID=3157069 RepID=UPI0033C3BDDD